jgi:RNA polymerase sigma-70 factor (ECF subfamily)
LSDSPEKIWLAALRNGDEKALRLIFDQHYALLMGDIYRILPDEDTCQDLAQEVFVELWRKRTELDIHTSLRAYLRRAAINRALNHLKTQRRTVLDDAETFSDYADDSSHDIALQEKQENLETALHAAIEKLPEKCRMVFSLSRFENLSHKEIAEQLGISVKTIENQITKAMKMLRDALTVLAVLSPAVILWLKWCLAG